MHERSHGRPVRGEEGRGDAEVRRALALHLPAPAKPQSLARKARRATRLLPKTRLRDRPARQKVLRRPNAGRKEEKSLSMARPTATPWTSERRRRRAAKGYGQTPTRSRTQVQ